MIAWNSPALSSTLYAVPGIRYSPLRVAAEMRLVANQRLALSNVWQVTDDRRRDPSWLSDHWSAPARTRRSARGDTSGRLGQADRQGLQDGLGARSRPHSGAVSPAPAHTSSWIVRRRPDLVPARHRGTAARTRLRVRPVLFSLHRQGRSSSASARGRLRLLPQAPPHPLPSGG